jgi:hypothetical protein
MTGNTFFYAVKKMRNTRRIYLHTLKTAMRVWCVCAGCDMIIKKEIEG